MSDDTNYVTKVEYLTMLRDMDCRISDAVKEAKSVASSQTDREEEALARMYEKTITNLEKQIVDLNARLMDLNTRLDKFFLAIIGVALSSLVSAVIMLAGILMGKI